MYEVWYRQLPAGQWFLFVDGLPTRHLAVRIADKLDEERWVYEAQPTTELGPLSENVEASA